MKKTVNLDTRWMFLFIIVLIVGISVVFTYLNNRSALSERQAMIHEKGAQVMPFDLNQTTHIFKKQDNGGIQQVIVKNKNNSQQISLIRMHLQMETELFQKGNFADPAKLHGGNMPGVQELSNGVGKIKITYSDLPNGGQIQYVTIDPNLIAAIHKWFDVQVSDHGSDAMRM